MPRTCSLSYRINNGPLTPSEFHLVKSDDRIIAPIREYEVQEYPESHAAEIYPYASKKPFDYTVKLLAFGDEATVVASVRAFWDSMFSGNTAHPVTLVNYWKGVQVTGYPKSPDTDSYYPMLVEYETSAYIFDLTIYVADPTTLTSL